MPRENIGGVFGDFKTVRMLCWADVRREHKAASGRGSDAKV